MAATDRSSIIEALSQVLGSKLALPGSEAYAESTKSYFTAQQSHLQPLAVIKPVSAQDVAVFIKTVTRLDILFAVRGGGHSPHAGSSNIQDGITVDMRNLADIHINDDKSVVSVGAGALWGHVYEKLEPLERSVAGGHGWNIGVAGFTLGGESGGISPFTPRYGFTCNLVQNYELVTAAGRILNANEDENADLWHALKGGSNNFGIVTRFDMLCFPQGKLWGGYIVNPATSSEKNLAALVELANGWDPYANIEQSYTYSPTKGGLTVVNSMEYTREEEDPDVLKPFTSIRPAYQNTMRLASISEIAKENQALQANGSRQTFSTTSFYLDLGLLRSVIGLFKKSVLTVKDIEDVRWTLTFRRLHDSLNIKQESLGGDSTGIGTLLKPLVICVLTCSWSSSLDDQLNEKAARVFMASVEQVSHEHDLYHPFQYLNYAAAWQDPLAGCDAVTRMALQAAGKKYDPDGVFQRLSPGGFKLFDGKTLA